VSKLLLALSAAVLLSTSVEGQTWAKAKLDLSPRHREWVTVSHDNRKVETMVVYPESASKTAAIILVHEIFGLTDWVEDMADQLAAAGYIVLAPDLLSGAGPNGGRSTSFDQDGAVEAVSHLSPGQVNADLAGVASYAQKLPAFNGKLFVAGFCWGGGQSFRFASSQSKLSAAFVFYGPPPASDEMARITAPVYGFYAGNDTRIDATIPDTIEAMKAAGKTYGPVTYAGAGHGFMRAGEAPDASPENKKARGEALQRLLTLLKKHD
jgi:carboxymethylenebutenolidase